MNSEKPTRNLALELVRVTEAAALSAGRFMGRGQKEVADKAAVDAMRLVLNSIDMEGVVVIGEGEKDEAPMLFNGEMLGTGKPPLVDVAVDPIDGTRPLANGFLNSIATVSIPLAFSQSAHAFRSGVFIPKHRTGMASRSVGTETHISSRCTSIPAAFGFIIVSSSACMSGLVVGNSWLRFRVRLISATSYPHDFVGSRPAQVSPG